MKQIQQQRNRQQIWDLQSHDSNIHGFDLSSSASEICLFIANNVLLPSSSKNKAIPKYNMGFSEMKQNRCCFSNILKHYLYHTFKNVIWIDKTAKLARWLRFRVVKKSYVFFHFAEPLSFP